MPDFEKNEFHKRTVWRKYFTHTRKEADLFMSRPVFAGVFCVREVSGYAVWYRRYLDDGALCESGTSLDGQYLLKFYEPAARHEAIEFAVSVSLQDSLDADAAITRLDQLAANCPCIQPEAGWPGPSETVD